MALPQQFIPGHLRLQASQPPGLVQGPGKRCSRVNFHNVGPLVPPSMAQSITESSIPSMGAQIIGSNPNGGESDQGGAMPVSVNPPAMNGVTSGSFPTQFAGAMQIWCPTQEEIIPAKRWVFKLWLV